MTTTLQDGIVIDQTLFVTDIGVVAIDAALGLANVFCTFEGLTPGPAVRM